MGNLCGIFKNGEHYANAFAWFFFIKQKRNLECLNRSRRGHLSVIHKDQINKRRLALAEAVLAFIHRSRTRSVWMHPRSLIWFDMIDQTFNDELWYASFRAKKETLALILNETEQDINRNYAAMRDAVSAKRRPVPTLIICHLLLNAGQLRIYLVYRNRLPASVYLMCAVL